jgi:hypothetical protein
MRQLLGYTGGPEEWVTGVNPRFTSFEGVGHGVQWDAASNLPLTDWAYGKINDGNLYPAVYFITPLNRMLYQAVGPVEVELNASDPDGSIREVELRLDSVPVQKLLNPPYKTKLELTPGDHWLEAVAYDLEGKSSTASILLQVDVGAEIIVPALPEAYAGTFYEFAIPGKGNVPLEFRLLEESRWPGGIRLGRDGRIDGICTEPGTYPVQIILNDAGSGVSTREFDFVVREKQEGTVLVKEIHYPHDSLRAESFVMKQGALPNLESGTEVSISQVGIYGGADLHCHRPGCRPTRAGGSAQLHC